MQVTRRDKAQNNMLEELSSVRNFNAVFTIADSSVGCSDNAIIRSSKE